MSSSLQTTPKLYYFPHEGRAEAIRLIYVLAGKEFEDIRFTEEEWPELKPTMPFNAVPVLEIDGERYGESIAIASYVAKECGLHGRSDLEELKINQIAQLVEEIWVPACLNYEMSDEGKKAADLERIRTGPAPKHQRYLENAVLKWGSKEYAVGDRLTLADILIYDLYTGSLGLMGYLDTAGEYPLSKAIVERVAENANIKKYKDAKNKAQ